MDKYLRWSRDALGITFNQPIHVNDCPELERGICCTQHVKSESIILTIPYSCLFSIKRIDSTSPFYNLSSLCREDDLLALLLLHEKYVIGKYSTWSNHISILPTSYDNVTNYSSKELSYLIGSNLHKLAIAWQDQIKQDYDSLLQLLERNGNDIDCTDWLSYDNYMWALSTIWTRFVTVDYGEQQQFKTMVPVFDLLNHSCASRVGHCYDPQQQCMYLYSAQEWEEGKEIFLNYGYLSNYKLLMLYGFTLAPSQGSNPYDTVDIWLHMDPIAPYYQQKKDALQYLNINDNEPFQISMNEFPQDLITCLRVHLATDESEVCRLTHATQPLSPGNEMKVHDALQRALEDMLAAYPSMIEQDEYLLRHWGLLSLDSVLPTPTAGSCEDTGENDVYLIELNDNESKLKRVKDCVVLRYSEKLIIKSVLHKISNLKCP